MAPPEDSATEGQDLRLYSGGHHYDKADDPQTEPVGDGLTDDRAAIRAARDPDSATEEESEI